MEGKTKFSKTHIKLKTNCELLLEKPASPPSKSHSIAHLKH